MHHSLLTSSSGEICSSPSWLWTPSPCTHSSLTFLLSEWNFLWINHLFPIQMQALSSALSHCFYPLTCPTFPTPPSSSSSCASLPPKRKVCKHFFTYAHWLCWWKWGEKEMGTQSHLGHLTFLMWTWIRMDASSLSMMMWLASLSSYFFWGQMKFTLAPSRRRGVQSSCPGGWSCLSGRGLGHTSFPLLAWLAPEAVMPQPGRIQTRGLGTPGLGRIVSPWKERNKGLF